MANWQDFMDIKRKCEYCYISLNNPKGKGICIHPKRIESNESPTNIYYCYWINCPYMD